MTNCRLILVRLHAYLATFQDEIELRPIPRDAQYHAAGRSRNGGEICASVANKSRTRNPGGIRSAPFDPEPGERYPEHPTQRGGDPHDVREARSRRQTPYDRSR